MEIFTEKLGDDFRKNCEMIDSLLRVDKSFDIIKREMKIAGANCVMYYIDGFVKAELMQKLMVYLISVKEIGDGSKDAAYTFAAKSVPTVEVDVTDSADNIILMVLSGCTAFLSEGFGPNAIIIDSRTYPTRSTEEPEGDRVMRGSRDGFVETLIFNTAMLRRRIRDTSFTVEYLNIGKRSRTDIAICYMDGIADAEYVSKLRANLESIDADSIILGHQSIAESLIRTRWYNPFPKIRSTERPDAAAASVLEGSVVVICDNTPEVMILPTSIFDFLQETDDSVLRKLPPHTEAIRFFCCHAHNSAVVSSRVKSRNTARKMALSYSRRSRRSSFDRSAFPDRIHDRRAQACLAQHAEHAQQFVFRGRRSASRGFCGQGRMAMPRGDRVYGFRLDRKLRPAEL